MLQLVAITCGSISTQSDKKLALDETLDAAGKERALLARNLLTRLEFTPDLVLTGGSLACTRTAQLVTNSSHDGLEIEHVPDLCYEHCSLADDFHRALIRLQYSSFAEYETCVSDAIRHIASAAWSEVKDVTDMNTSRFAMVVTYPGLLQALLLEAVHPNASLIAVIKDSILGPCEGFRILFSERGPAAKVELLQLED